MVVDMPIKRKLRYWAAIAPLFVFFILGAVVRPDYLDSLGAVLLLAIGLYLAWAGAYWTLLQARRLYLLRVRIARKQSLKENGAEEPTSSPQARDAWWVAGRAFGRIVEFLKKRRPNAPAPEKSEAQLAEEAWKEAARRNEVPTTIFNPYVVVRIGDSRWQLTASAAETQLDAPGVPQAHLDIVQAIDDLGCTFVMGGYDFGSGYERALLQGRIEDAEDMLRRVIIPHGPPELYERIQHAGGGSRFAAGMDLEAAGLFVGSKRAPDAIEVGIAEPPAVTPAVPLFHQGEGHILTIASTGAGKGQRYILPTLMTYGGPVLCLDPKGENFRATGLQRDLMGGVFKWAPFDRNGETHAFNPLDVIEDWDDARVVADLLITPSDSGEKRFWDHSARDVVRGLIMYVRTLEPERRTMREVVRLLYASAEEHEALRTQLAKSDDEMLVELANQFDVMADRMFDSILQSARAELDAWRSKQIANATSTTSPGWDIHQFVSDLREREAQIARGERYGPLGYHHVFYMDDEYNRLERGPSKSMFFVVPPDRIRSYASVLRVVMGVHLNAWARAENLVEEDHPDWRVDHQVPALFVFDELAQLGHMPLIEDQIAIARSAKIRMWLIAQDLPQLKVTYPRWESMLGNCRTQIFFGVNDMETATYVSSRAGDKTTVFEETRPLVPPAELMGPAFKHHAMVYARATPPIKVRLPEAFHEDERMRQLAEIAVNLHEQYPVAPLEGPGSGTMVIEFATSDQEAEIDNPVEPAQPDTSREPSDSTDVGNGGLAASDRSGSDDELLKPNLGQSAVSDEPPKAPQAPHDSAEASSAACQQTGPSQEDQTEQLTAPERDGKSAARNSTTKRRKPRPRRRPEASTLEDE
ncbi:type IV secretory system conjugative DNA transfer family protein [Amorphus sp. MBR-141]